MIISEVITHLEKLKAEHGDIKVCVCSDHEYWGNLYNEVQEHNLGVTEHAQPEGPKSGKSEKAVVFNY
jgi:hypothetical protein